MTETVLASGTLMQRVQRIQDAMLRAGLTPIDMRRAGTLETDLQVPDFGGVEPFDAPEIERLEGEYGAISQRQINRRNESKFRWFIDGSQMTVPVWRIGVVPIVVSIAVAGLLERDSAGACQVVPGTLIESIAWIVPQQTGDPDIRAVVDILHAHGQVVRDPLDQSENYQQLAGMYDQVLFYAKETAGKLREQAELQVVTKWESHHRHLHPQSWLVIDGRMSIEAPNAVGLIKNPEGQHLVGSEAVTLLSLPAGYRTTAYRVTGRARARTHWYQRMWPSEGMDARRALIRVEASGDMADSEEIDAIASWLMAERVPRPTSDSRWPTLLYPVHILERILKRRINQITTGWPV